MLAEDMKGKPIGQRYLVDLSRALVRLLHFWYCVGSDVLDFFGHIDFQHFCQNQMNIWPSLHYHAHYLMTSHDSSVAKLEP